MHVVKMIVGRNGNWMPRFNPINYWSLFKQESQTM